MMELVEDKEYLAMTINSEWLVCVYFGGWLYPLSGKPYSPDEISKVIPIELATSAPDLKASNEILMANMANKNERIDILQAENEQLRESIDAYEKLIEDAPFKLALERIVSIFESGYEAYNEIYYTAKDALMKAGKVQEQSE